MTKGRPTKAALQEEIDHLRRRVAVLEGSAAQTRTARELARTKAHLERLHRARDEFVATVSHEVRSPLVTTLGYIELLLEGRLGPISAEAAAKMSIAARNLGSLSVVLDETFGYHDLVRGDFRAEPSRASVDAEQVLVGCVERFLASRVRTAGAVRLDLSPGLPAVEATERMLERAVSALLAHAEQRGGGRADIEIAARLAEPTGVEVSVTASADNSPVVGEAPRRDAVGEPTPEQPAVGTSAGVGLTIARTILSAHGIQLRTSADARRGSTVSFTLPLAEGPDR